LIGLIII
jgi:DNA repair protein RAD7